MRFSFTALLLAVNFSSTFASPLPSHFNDIERRWSEGQSEVCALSGESGCYIFAWVQALVRRVCRSSAILPPSHIPIMQHARCNVTDTALHRRKFMPPTRYAKHPHPGPS